MSFQPYLMFGGNCREAFTRYQEILGGELFVMAMKDMPEGEPVPADQADLVMHAALTLEGSVLMASDDPTTDKFGPVQGMQVSYNVAEVAEAKRVFDALAEGGEVTMPIQETFWSPMFGMCVDRFGTPWMISADPPAGSSPTN
jgi:PhnB protein